MAELDARRVAAVLAADPELDVLARLAARAPTAIFMSLPTPPWSSVSNGSDGRISRRTYSGRNLPASSRDSPNVVCVRSFVPKLKNSASRGDLVGRDAARGTSIIVPTQEVDLDAFRLEDLLRGLAHDLRLVRELAHVPDERNHDLRLDVDAFLLDAARASMMARVCMRVISGYVMPSGSRGARASGSSRGGRPPCARRGAGRRPSGARRSRAPSRRAGGTRGAAGRACGS